MTNNSLFKFLARKLPGVALFSISLGLCLTGLADVTLAPLFTDGAVLQRDKPVQVWGMADPGEGVSVTFHEHALATTADPDGKWSVSLPAMSANHWGSTLVVTGNNTLTVNDILVGEVWLCSGQSNMEWTVSRSLNAEKEIAAADYPLIRHVKVIRTVSDTPMITVETTGWLTATPENVGDFSAAAYFFGRELQQTLGIPVGLVQTSWGGTRIEAWSSSDALATKESFQSIYERWDAWLAGHPRRMADYEKILEDYKTRRADAEAAGEESLTQFDKENKWPRKPPPGEGSQDTPSTLYNAMLAPLIPYGIRGTLWYQGESNTRYHDQYHDLFVAMITDWRAKFGQGDFPFYWVQLANFGPHQDPNERDWAYLREAQTQTLKLQNTAQAVIVDIGNNYNIHPKNKLEVGRRLAAYALNQVHGYASEVTGPVFSGVTRDSNQLRVAFTHAESGLIARDGRIRDLEIAGEDGIFHPANGEIAGSILIVTSPEVDEPKQVRYAFKDALSVNLFGVNGLPVAPFRSDSQ